MTEPMDTPQEKHPDIDLAEVERLVTAIEADLAKVRSGSENVDALRAGTGCP